MEDERRKEQIDSASEIDFDALIIGGGISGAAIFRQLSLEGYRVLLVDKGDFAGATSQSSAMMAWGNLHDLRKLSLISVARLSASRDKLVRDHEGQVFPANFRYLPTSAVGRARISAALAFQTYWLLSAGRRARPKFRREFSERTFLKQDEFAYSYDYEEASVAPSDARFVLSWILDSQNCETAIAVNYCGVDGGRYEPGEKRWNMHLSDSISGYEFIAGAKCVINAAGVWTDRLNSSFGIESPFKHAFGKGVFLGLRRNSNHESTLMIETVDAEGCLALVPWGPISLWGPTETRVHSPDEGFQATAKDIRFLIKEVNRHVATPVKADDIVSLRCGVRPLAVPVSFPDYGGTFEILREYKVCADKKSPWISVYGGKITSSGSSASWVSREMQRYGLIPEAGKASTTTQNSKPPDNFTFGGLQDLFPSPRWCAENEMCRTIDDYLRRRTNISQWIERGGFGKDDEFAEAILALALDLNGGDETAARAAVEAYRDKVKVEFDAVIAAV